MKFYYGLQNLELIHYTPRFLLSYYAFRNLKTIVNNEGKEWQLDSGGFTLGIKNTLQNPFKYDYNWNIETYADFINRQQPTIAWTMDAAVKYPYTKDIIAKKQEITNEKTAKLIDYTHKKIGNILQGWAFEDYIDHIDKMKESGTLTDWIGISVSRAKKNKYFARDLILMLSKNLPSRIKLHGLGFKYALLRPFPILRKTLYSADSANWFTYGQFMYPKDMGTGALLKYINEMEIFLSNENQNDIYDYF